MYKYLPLLLLLIVINSEAPIRTGPGDALEDEFDVYSTYLNDLTKTLLDYQKVKLIVVSESTLEIYDTCRPVRLEVFDKSIANAKIRPMLEDIRNISKKKVTLQGKFKTEVPILLLSDDALGKIFKPNAEDGWEEFYKKYPASAGHVAFSRVSFNESRNKAMIFVSIGSGMLSGSGDYILYEKIGGKWKQIKSYNCWVS